MALPCPHVPAAMMAPGQADAFGLYPVHYAAMNEDEQSPQILEAILKANRFAALQVRVPVRSRLRTVYASCFTCCICVSISSLSIGLAAQYARHSLAGAAHRLVLVRATLTVSWACACACVHVTGNSVIEAGRCRCTTPAAIAGPLHARILSSHCVSRSCPPHLMQCQRASDAVPTRPHESPLPPECSHPERVLLWQTHGDAAVRAQVGALPAQYHYRLCRRVPNR